MEKSTLLTFNPPAYFFYRDPDLNPKYPHPFQSSGQSLGCCGYFQAASGRVTCGISRTSAVKSAT